ncbi:unnamed protein product [Durusdinium trenchii]|uniref:Apple domain-containing protein n=1 Tax=Durusdinium trenchii TaxID=1381693 RepID=A0ABP0KXX0_9DINO
MAVAELRFVLPSHADFSPDEGLFPRVRSLDRAIDRRDTGSRAPEDLRETRRAAMKLLTWAVLVAPAWGAEAPCAKTGVAYEVSDRIWDGWMKYQGHPAWGAYVPNEVSAWPFGELRNAGYVADALACQQSCQTSLTCQSYTWKGDSTPKGGCWHFTAVGKELSAPGAVSGPKTCALEVASAAASAAGETGEAKLNSISDAVTAGVNGAVDNMANGASSVAQQGSDAVAGVGSAVNSAANGAADAAASGTEKVASAFTSASDAVTGAAAGATAGVSNGVAGVASAAGDVAADPFAILTTGAPVASTTKFDRKSDAKAWWFPVALVVVVALACGVRICAFFLFGSNYTKKEKEKELNKKKISMSAQGWEASETRKKQLQSQSRVPAGSAMPGVYSQQLPPVLMSGSYQVPQAGSPLGYVMPPVTVGGGSPMASYGQVPVTGQPQYYVQQ